MTNEPRICAAEDCEDPVLARDLCRNHYYAAKRKAKREALLLTRVRNCEQCPNPIPPERRAGAKFCSPECKQAALNEAARVATKKRRAARVERCAWCRDPIPPDRRIDARFCSPECNDAWHNHQKGLQNRRARTAARTPCEVCKNPIPEDRRRDATYCSDRCKRSAGQSQHPRARVRNFDWQLQNKYSITLEQYNAMLDAQDGVCACCGTDDWGSKGPHVDHDHACCPGKKSCGRCVRGLLCNNCNQGLGQFKDDMELLQAAAEYLERVGVDDRQDH